jgi:CRP-like cAMP-binding protein
LGAGDAFGFCSLLQPDHQRMATCIARSNVAALSMDKIRWAETVHRGDLLGSVLRVAMIRALADQLAQSKSELARIGERQEGDLGPLVKAVGGSAARLRKGGKPEKVPDYLKGVT